MKTFKIKVADIAANGFLRALFFSLLILYAEQSFCAQRDFFEDNVTYKLDNLPIKEDVVTFEQLGVSSAIKLQGNLAQKTIGFGSRLDELVTAAKVDVTYTYSPSLSHDISHVRVRLNNQIAGYLPVEANKAGIPVKNTLSFDPRFLSKSNEISFELIAFREMRCATKAQMSMWFDISNQSQLILTVQPLPLKNDFAFFPKPFFDSNDYLPVEVPFIFPENAHSETSEAAGITASYLGSLAKWRGMSFPVLINQLPRKHAVVFATNNKRPDFLKDLPPVNAPTIQLITHPNNSFVKLLLVLGRDKQDLRNAIEGLANGAPLLAGSSAEITHVKEILPRKPYDAPNWVPINRQIKFGELIDSPTQLQAKGRTPRPISVRFSIPPDLFIWGSRGIPLNIKYRYSPPNKEDDSQLSVMVNDLFVKGLPLTEKGIGESSGYDGLKIPFVDNLISNATNEVLVPGFRLGAKNEIQFDYEFTKPDSGDCIDLTANYMYGEIDADSTIDLTGFSHYMAMPDLKAFASVGFPFTRLADLSDTAIILDRNATTSEMEAYLDLLGSFGASTGLTATKFTVFDSAPFKGIENKDVLVIGFLAANIMQETDPHMLFNAMISEIKKTITLPIRDTEYMTLFQPAQIKLSREVFKQVEFKNEGEVGALIGFESPWQKNKSVVAVMASKPEAFKKITSALIYKTHNIFGTVSLFRDDEVVNTQVGETYYVGQLPVIKLILFEFSDRPILLGFLTLLMIILMVVVFWQAFKYVAYWWSHRHDN